MGTQQLILYTVVSLVVGVVLFLMFSVQQRGQEASMDATQYRAAKQGMLNLVEMVEQDFKNVGSYMYWDENASRFVAETSEPPNETAIRSDGVEREEVENGYHYTFEFHAQVDSTRPPAVVRYEWMPMDRVVTLENGTERELYRVERYVDGDLSGTSENMVTSMDVELRPDTTGAANTIFNPEDTRQIDVSITAVSPLGRGKFIEQSIFESAYRPRAMAIDIDQLGGSN